MQVTDSIVGFPINYSVSECYHSALPWKFPHEIINTRALNAFSHYHKCSLNIIPRCSNRSSVITFDYVHYYSRIVVPHTLPVTTASAILVTLHEQMLPRCLYIWEKVLVLLRSKQEDAKIFWSSVTVTIFHDRCIIKYELRSQGMS